MTETITIRPSATADTDWVLALNNSAVPAVNALDGPALRALIAAADLVRVADLSGRPAGFLIVFAPGSPYASLNYRWFDARHDEFRYIDRIVVDAAARGRGLARQLYAALDRAVGGIAGPLCCEVNAVPPNPGSLHFHQAQGFREVARQSTDAGAKQVILMEKWFNDPGR